MQPTPLPCPAPGIPPPHRRPPRTYGPGPAGLTDLCYGDWEGLPLAEVKKRYADLYRQWEAAPTWCAFPMVKPWRKCGPGPGTRCSEFVRATLARQCCGRTPGGEQGPHGHLHWAGRLPLLASGPGHHGHQPLPPGERGLAHHELKRYLPPPDHDPGRVCGFLSIFR